MSYLMLSGLIILTLADKKVTFADVEASILMDCSLSRVEN